MSRILLGVASVLGACVAPLWLLLALFFLGNAGDSPSGTCLERAPAYALVLAAVALLGIALLAKGSVTGLRALADAERPARPAIVSIGAAALVGVAWLILAFGLLPDALPAC